jgi:hypothetical protein
VLRQLSFDSSSTPACLADIRCKNSCAAKERNL